MEESLRRMVYNQMNTQEEVKVKRIDKSNPLPLYNQLMEIIISMIENGKFDAHDKLPSEREFCEKYDVSRITVRQTLQELEKEGYIYKQHGKGTYVAPKKFGQQLFTVYSFTEEMKRLDKNPETKVLSFELIKPKDRIRTALHLGPEDEVYKIMRLRLADSVPMLLETSYLPAAKFPFLTKEALKKKPMYYVFEEDYSIKVERAIEQFHASNIDEKTAKLLKINQGEACMNIKRSTYFHDEVVEYTETVARGDQFFYTAELQNPR